MRIFLGQLFTLLAVPPGNFVYHIVVVFSIVAALAGAIRSLRSGNFPLERRTVTGLAILLGLQLGLFAFGGYTQMGLLKPEQVFPPLDRVVTLLALVWIIWLWAFPEPLRMADAATLLLSLLALALFGLTLAFWAPKPTPSFNLSNYEIGWQVFSIAVSLLGIVILVLRKPAGWIYGLAMLILALLGHGFTLLFPVDGALPGFVRMSQLAMYPILLALGQRLPLPASGASASSKALHDRSQRIAALDIERDRSIREAQKAQQQAAEVKRQYEQKMMELGKQPPVLGAGNMELIASISQELRQHTSSIIGYTDHLMGDSVGNLGPLQRKFIERIKASGERVDSLVDDLLQTANLEGGKREFTPEPVDLNLIIDNAMADTSAQIREKNITLRLDLAGATAPIQTDRNALQKILIHLLQNAAAAAQNEGNITLRVKQQEQDARHFLSIQVADDGGGIAPDDLPRVFTRRFRAENSLIKGLGDTGVGLSITKALVEAQNGRIWVETAAGAGSTFNVLIPLGAGLPAEDRS